MNKSSSIFDPHAARAATAENLRSKAAFLLNRFHHELARLPGAEAAALDESHAQPALRLNPVTWVEMSPDMESYLVCQWVNGQKAIIFQSQNTEQLLNFMETFNRELVSERNRLSYVSSTSSSAAKTLININFSELAEIATFAIWALVILKLILP
jgi:hypothetical protein